MRFLKDNKMKVNILIIFLTFLFLGTPFFSARAIDYYGIQDVNSIHVNDAAALAAAEKQLAGDTSWFSWEKGWENFKAALKESGSKALASALRNALKKIAYDTATWIGTGGRGQKPLFITEDWGAYLGNIADNAAGEFIEKLGRDPNFYGEFNLCQPNLDVQVKIGLGLVQQYRPADPVCTFSKMKQNWENELSRGDFLYRFRNMFEPEGNDLLTAFNVSANIVGTVNLKEELGQQDRIETKGWLDIRNLAGERVSPPSEAARELQAATDLQTGNFGDFTGDALVDASNVFLNQLALTAFQTAMRKLGEGGANSTSPYDWSRLTDFESGPYNGGISGAQDRLSGIINPNFSVRGDYDILAELTMCPDPTKAGPTECVITDRFRDAVSNKLTVLEAINKGYINDEAVFGFKVDGIEPLYNEGIPYRSMIILRKFRIIPVGWEVAAQKIKDDGNKIYNIGEMVECFDPSDGLDGFYETWCDSLVDPNWVLKAPLNYCRREGPGPEILSESVSGSGDNSTLKISRNDNYCADEQSCIDENNDGSCNIYGYCTADDRMWSFDSDSCEPKYNTCQTFQGEDGSKVSYLKNTLDYSECSIDNAGCSQYFTAAFSYDSNTNNVVWDTTATLPVDVMYFDNDASECSDSNEGCTQLIRTGEGIGANLLPNSSFEEGEDLLAPVGTIDTFDFWGNIGEGNSDSLDGYLSLELASGNTSVLVDAGPSGYNLSGENFYLSVYAKDCTAGSIAGIGEGIIPGSGIASTTIGTTNEWGVYRVARTYPATYFSNQVEIFFDIPAGGSCLIDSIKLERGSSPTRYSSYMDTGVIYEKLIPEYLYDSCYQAAGSGNYQLLASRPLECDTYSRLCTEEEVGCNLFTSIKDNISVPAKVGAQDYCPDVCVGYDAYIQSETAFDSIQDQYFIPNTAKSCSAQSVGCDEFTNLDKTEEGGEALEYYTSLKQCIKPTDPTADCGEYYTWEGSKETGYQLKVFSLQNDASGVEPDVISNDSAECYEAVYYASSTSPLYNPDCREYYAKSGQVYYHLNSRVITCSDNCHPYRRTEDNVIKQPGGADYDQTTCLGLGYDFDTDQNYCVECINGGVWNTQHNACIYMAIPKEGESCSASQAGCREYGGNSGRNTKIILNNDFEGNTQGWVSEGGTTVDVSNESLMVGGNSLYVSGGSHQTSNELGYDLTQGDAYVLSFIAKGDGNVATLDFNFENSSGTSSSFSQSVTLGATSWEIYEVNILSLDHTIDSGEKLVITADNNFYIDDIRLTNIQDRYYLIKNSWVMPEINGRDICNWDIIADGPSPLYSLFCEQYTDKDNKAYSLRGFSNLCQESAVGCEVMIDTHNSSNFDSEILPGGAITPQVTVPGDNYVYAVYNEDKLCDSNDKGCQRMGKASAYEGQILTQDFYIKNDPDKYGASICSAAATECGEWSTNNGLAYFKDPGDQICEWGQAPETLGGGWGWYKKEVKRCDDDRNGSINTTSLNSTCFSSTGCTTTENTLCSNDDDCTAGAKCILDENIYDCITDSTVGLVKTLGEGGYGNKVDQPAVDTFGNYWAGVCSASDSGCTEYIDPISKFSSNLIFNSDFSQDIDMAGGADGWEVGYQNINLKANTLYVLSVDGANRATLNSPVNIYQLDYNNNLNSVSGIIVNSASGERHSEQFYSYFNTQVEISALYHSTANGTKIELREAVVDYKVNNFASNNCNGIVDFEKGCVLFNERSFDSGDNSYLNLDADLSFDDGNGVAPSSATVALDNDSNRLLQVRPDRDCGEWLACKSYIKDNEDNEICYDIGLCDALDDNGSCKSFVVNGESPVNQIFPGSVENFDNKTGYSKVAYDFTQNSFNQPNDYYRFEEMTQVGESTKTINGNFETFSSEGYPISWSNASTTGVAWNRNSYRVIKSPVDAQESGVGNGPEGRAYLSMGPAFEIVSEFIDVSPNTTYILSAYLNTIKVNEPTATANVMVEEYNASETLTSLVNSISLGAGYDWTKKVDEFVASPGTTKIKILLSSTNSPSSNFFFDDINVRPALNSREDFFSGNEYYTTQECRLYPEDDSLSCEYTEDSGLRQKGWYGYCLEHDVYPGNKDACLLWWPIDNVKGTGNTDNYGGYLGKTPVYYCTEGDEEVTNVSIPVPNLNGNAGGSPDETDGYADLCHNGHITTYIDIDDLYEYPPDDPTILSIRDIHFIDFYQAHPLTDIYIPDIDTDASGHMHHGGSKWVATDWSYDGFSHVLTVTGSSGGWGDCQACGRCGGKVVIPNMTFDEVRKVCTQFSQVVTTVGDNKFWAGRVYEGSEFLAPCNVGYSYLPFYDNPTNCAYSTQSSPFGSMNPPAYSASVLANPYEWDGRPDVNGIQPLYFSREDSALSAGQEYDPYNISRLFATSYGSWEWQGSDLRCSNNASVICDITDNQCPGGDCGMKCISGIGGFIYSATALADADITVSDLACTSDLDCESSFSHPTTTSITDYNLLNACDLASNQCGLTGDLCYSNADCEFDTSCDYAACVGGTNTGGYCDREHDCPGGTCAGEGIDLGRYHQTSLIGWSLPTSTCPLLAGVPTRPSDPFAANAYCVIPPVVNNANVFVNDVPSGVILKNGEIAHLTFTSDIDSNQEPLVGYYIYWDGVDGANYDITSVSGVEINSQPNLANPHSAYHLYSYWDLKQKNTLSPTDVVCGNQCQSDTECQGVSAIYDGPFCRVQPRIKIKDNWGWCNGGVAGNQCPLTPVSHYSDWVVVTSEI